MPIVDTQVHTSLNWFEPVEVIIFQMDRAVVEKATLVQLEGQADNSYILDCARRFPGRFCPVVYVDHKRPDAPATLKKLVQQGAGGIRVKPTSRSPGTDPLAIWRTCNDLKLTVSTNGKESDFGSEQFSRLVKEMPQVPFVIEHLAHPEPDEPPPYEGYRKVLALARLPNVYIKVGGLNEICQRPYPPYHEPLYTPDNIPPFIRMAFEAFGARRMMWGSDYPPVSKNEGYTNCLAYLLEHLAAFTTAEDREWITGKTALSVFRFDW
ncbi:MAG: amidohydrolase [Chloroflexi bacterium]|nr:amidohydrolase [Chloroflexota bacterium]